MKILLVEDEPALQEIVRSSLEKERYVVEVADTCIAAMRKVNAYAYDCILLDIMLPDGSGLQLLEHLKKMQKQENVIIISAKDSLDDKVMGLELGADDYLPKPFHLAELHARIRSVIRRGQRGGEMEIKVENLTIDPDKHIVRVGDTVLDLGRKEYDILLYFVNRRGHLVKKEVLAEAVWGDDIDQADSFDFIYAQLKNVRRKLAAAGAEVEIKTVYGFGYKLV
jgi:DNA-binding response OmpR family regulator